MSGLLAGCGTTSPASKDSRPTLPTSGRTRYGDEDSQFADLRMPAADSLGTVVLLHGGYWLPEYGLELMEPLALHLTALGYATWNVEYRRTGAGGGFPTTLTDVGSAIDRLDGPGMPRGITDDVVLLGHSAGGHLAVWAASRTSATPGGAAKVRPRGAISLAGVLDLVLAGSTSATEQVGAFMGATPAESPQDYELADPTQLVPAGCPVWVVSAEDDETVPPAQARSYVAAARAAGGVVQSVVVPGDHMAVISPSTAAFPTIGTLLSEAVA
jgi:acetyl esterase/lipase